ncbi:S9 family peptidase, partial [bacterium]|nr:S9 family peptidase [bacterium]
PIISLQHGTQVNRNNAPSKFDPNPGAFLQEPLRPETDEALLNYLECAMGASMAGMGYIVVMPDYPGFGDNADIHPYVHGSLGDCVRDAVKETIALTMTDQWKDRLSWNGRLYLIGYSEGGYATMVGAKSLAAMTDGKIRVTAAIPCDGAYDLSGTMTARIVTSRAEINPHYVPYTFIGYESIYGVSVFKSPSPFKGGFAKKLPCLFDGNHCMIQMYKTIPRAGLFSRRYRASDILGAEVLRELGDSSSPLFKAIRENDAFRGWSPDFAMRIVHCETDDVVPVENAIAAYRAFGGPEAANVELVYVRPVDFAADSADVHTRAFPAALLDGFSYIEKNESAMRDDRRD